jgi:hypothetical protein
LGLLGIIQVKREDKLWHKCLWSLNRLESSFSLDSGIHDVVPNIQNVKGSQMKIVQNDRPSIKVVVSERTNPAYPSLAVQVRQDHRFGIDLEVWTSSHNLTG